LTRALLIRNQPLAPHRTSATYELKQFLLFLLATGMLAEAGVAIYQEMYDYRILTPAVQAVGYVRTSVGRVVAYEFC
jgi:Ni,Fe-hydrogenase I cytochrome b subunit